MENDQKEECPDSFKEPKPKKRTIQNRKRKNGEKKEPEDASVQTTSPDSPILDVVDLDEKKESDWIEPKRRKVSTMAENVEDSSQKPIPHSSSKLSKKEKAVNDFMMEILPAMKKTLKQKKANSSPFHIKDHSEYFQASSHFKPTFCLSLFHFLGKNEIHCSRYGNFEGKHLVKTHDGFKHVQLLLSHCDSLSEDECKYLMTRFGKEWYKIPSKDGVKAQSASKYGTRGEFKITLIGLYEDSFYSVDEDKEIKTINPILKYEPLTIKEKEKTPKVSQKTSEISK